MHVHVQSSSLFMILLIFIFSTLINSQTSFCAEDLLRYTNCRQPSNCGQISKITYPFWGINRANYCGVPGFEIYCQNNIPRIRIMSNTLRILVIIHEERILRVARDDLWDNTCPTHFYNTSIDPSPFNYAPEQRNVTLFYDCRVPSDLGLGYFRHQPGCTKNGTTINVFYALSNFPINDPTGRSCNNSVIVPIMEKSVQALEANKLNDALDGGFNLQWNLDDDQCDTCVESGGVCGFNLTENEFVCFCGNLRNSTRCSSRPGTSYGRTIGLGVGLAAGVVGLAFLGVLSFFVVRRRKRKISDRLISKDIETPASSKSTNITATTTTTSTSTSTDYSRSIPSYRSSKSEVGKGISTYFGAQVFNYIELEEATNNFDSAKECGDGGFGTVYYGVLKDGREVAVKRLYEHNFKRVEQFMTEVEILTRLRHPNLVTLYGCTSRHSRELLLVYEYISNGTLADHLHGRKSNSGLLNWSIRLGIAIETADAIAYLHTSDVIHRDVKTNNILLDQNFHVKVADFGLSRLFPNDVTHVSTAPQGTPGYVDPDYYQCYKLTDKSDVYSFGVVLVELISSLPAVDTNRMRYDINLSNMAITRIQNHTLHELIDPGLGFETDNAVRNMITSVAELAFRCLQQDREIRPSMQEVAEVLRGIQDNEKIGKQKAEEVDICNTDDEVVLLKNVPPPVSPESSSF